MRDAPLIYRAVQLPLAASAYNKLVNSLYSFVGPTGSGLFVLSKKFIAEKIEGSFPL